MENLANNIFQIDSKIVRDTFMKYDNIKVVDVSDEASNLCVVYFSSNELYYPNTEYAFRNTIEKRDKYEWINTKYPGAKRHIFIRDIQKQWYLEGVSVKNNTPELLANQLNQLCYGYTVYTIGSSAGGFAALLFGSMIKATRVYAFNAQLDLNIIIKDSNPFVDPILYKYKHDEARARYYQVSNFLNTETKYFYFQSAKSEMDIVQYITCSKKSFLKKIEFSTSNHGFPFLRHNLLYVLRLSEEELDEMAKHKLHPFVFSVKVDGFWKAFYLSGKAVLKRLKKKWYDEKRVS